MFDIPQKWLSYILFFFFFQENPARANSHIFNVGNPDNEVTVRQLAEMMTEVKDHFMCVCGVNKDVLLT